MIGLVKVTVISTSAPVTAGSPCFTLMLFTTVGWAVKLGFKSCVEKRSVWLLLFRVAESISTSEGEFSRVGTCGVRLATESSGERWENFIFPFGNQNLSLFPGGGGGRGGVDPGGVR